MVGGQQLINAKGAALKARGYGRLIEWGVHEWSRQGYRGTRRMRNVAGGSCWGEVRCTTMPTSAERLSESGEDERSGGNGDGKRTGDCAGWSASDGSRFFVGFLVSGNAERAHPWAPPGHRDAARSAAGARPDKRWEGVCDP